MDDMKTLSRTILVILLFFLAANFYTYYKNKAINKNLVLTPTPSLFFKPSPSLDSSENDLNNDVQKTYNAVIVPGESAKVQCGEGKEGNRVIFTQGSFSGNIGRGDQTEISISVIDANNQSTGALVEWRLYNWGRLEINGCQATFIAPDSIGTAYSVSASINARAVPESSPPSPINMGGEGGPIIVGYVATTKVTILSGAKPTCHNPPGVAISINSVPTTDNVQIIVDTPKFLGREYNARNATVRDGVGNYYIQIFVNGALYGQTNSSVANCQLPTVRF